MKVKDPTGGRGTVMVLLERLNQWRLPRALKLKARVDRGEKLDARDRQFLEEVAQDARHAQTLAAQHPDLQPLVKKLLDLYNDITQKALENEQASGGPT